MYDSFKVPCQGTEASGREPSYLLLDRFSQNNNNSSSNNNNNNNNNKGGRVRGKSDQGKETMERPGLFIECRSTIKAAEETNQLSAK